MLYPLSLQQRIPTSNPNLSTHAPNPATCPPNFHPRPCTLLPAPSTLIPAPRPRAQVSKKQAGGAVQTAGRRRARAVPLHQKGLPFPTPMKNTFYHFIFHWTQGWNWSASSVIPRFSAMFQAWFFTVFRAVSNLDPMEQISTLGLSTLLWREDWSMEASISSAIATATSATLWPVLRCSAAFLLHPTEPQMESGLLSLISANMRVDFWNSAGSSWKRGNCGLRTQMCVGK